jgi:2Fe-2S ferredoxin
MAQLRILQSETTLSLKQGEDLLRALQAAGHPISTSCGGRATCGLCRLVVRSGKELLTPLNSEELLHLGNVARVIGARLACQACIAGEGEISVEVPAVDPIELRKLAKASRIQRQRALEAQNRAQLAGGSEGPASPRALDGRWGESPSPPGVGGAGVEETSARGREVVVRGRDAPGGQVVVRKREGVFVDPAPQGAAEARDEGKGGGAGGPRAGGGSGARADAKNGAKIEWRPRKLNEPAAPTKGRKER